MFTRSKPAWTRSRRILSAQMLLGGAVFLGAGAWLAVLGGSPFYIVLGLLMLWVGVELGLARAQALWVMAALVFVTLLWALWEVGLDWWALVPRGDLPVVLAVLVLLAGLAGALTGTSRQRWGGILFLTGTLCLSALVGLAAMSRDPDARPGALPEAGVSVGKDYGGVPDADWWAYGRSLRGERWSPLSQLTPENVAGLQPLWTYRTGDLARPGDPDEFTYEVTPLKVDDKVYLCTPHNIIIALDATTGEEVWRHDPEIEVQPDMQHLSCRGLAFSLSERVICPRRIVATTNDGRLLALDAQTGRPCPDFGRDGEVRLDLEGPGFRPGWYQFTSAPLVTRNLIVLGGAIHDNADVHVPSGVIRAFDLGTGKLVWNFDPGQPTRTEPLAEGARYMPSTPNSWGTATADEELGLVYIPMGMGAVDQFGGDRPATTEQFATSILALDLATGRPRWVFQAVHHDLWDMDLGAQPTLVDLDLGHGPVPALVQPTKTGDLFVLDRRNGAPLHEVKELPVPKGAAQGDYTAPTQPFSALSLRPPRLREADLWGATGLDQLWCRISFRRLRYEGDYTPPSEKGSLVYPGNFGVFDWGGIAVDPERQVAFANPNAMAFVDQLVRRATAQDSASADQPSSGNDIAGSTIKGLNPNAGAPYAVALNAFLSPLGLPCQAPPWGWVAGVDLRGGSVAWQHRNGTVEDQSPLPLPFRMGVPALGGPVMTRGGLAFLSSTLDQYLRAYDVTTGNELWKARLPAGAQATPMTYQTPDGRQVVLVVAGGHGSLGTRAGDYVMAWALRPASGN